MHYSQKEDGKNLLYKHAVSVGTPERNHQAAQLQIQFEIPSKKLIFFFQNAIMPAQVEPPHICCYIKCIVAVPCRKKEVKWEEYHSALRISKTDSLATRIQSIKTKQKENKILI